ncbi:NAD(P)H-quinone oxidoreductase subunit J, chloroplastic [bioreactor metagenome]|uniref:NAD(P)H-quinone oxidoreductase subunit J, chloroplastic n=1 Tax=bioreactor metagenome TaxID=1076179 RepID=A0A644SV83_9ZZZZ|nr:NADH-quinone oxidoreductase subunit C [Negativicutes bacterium]
MSNNNELLAEIQAQYSRETQIIGEDKQQFLLVEPEYLLKILGILKNYEAYQFDMLRNLTAVDYLEYMEMVYHLYSLPLRHSITIKARCAAENSQMPSVTSIWPSANFQEREVYDLLGITFTGHPDLRRILMPAEFTEHPLRKSFKAGAGQLPGGGGNHSC